MVVYDFLHAVRMCFLHYNFIMLHCGSVIYSKATYQVMMQSVNKIKYFLVIFILTLYNKIVRNLKVKNI